MAKRPVFFRKDITFIIKNVFNQAQVNVVDRTDCNQGAAYNGKVTPEMFCAGNWPSG